MKQADLDFVLEMVKQLDESIRQLTLDEQRISKKIAKERIEELREYWLQNMDAEEAEEFKLTFDHWDRMLIVNWARMQRAHDTRAKAGQAMMKQHDV
ncbi:MAG: hypothetical protein GQ583_09155 [Methyloprofundus sp.]|nr:hypothetical protein [Methyloprofundus sp.]